MASNEPLISVIIPAYNRAGQLPAAVLSVQAQTYSQWEIIIVDDGSKDNTVEVINRLMADDKRICFARHETNRGAQAARNSGIKAAQGDWIAFLDSDDQYLPESLSLRINRALQDNVSVVHSEAYIQHQDKPLELYRVPNWSGNIYKKILSKEGPMFPSLLIKKDALERVGYLDENIKSYQEWDTCIRLAKHYSFGFVAQPTFIYDYRTTNAISRDSIRAGIGYEQSLGKHWAAILVFHGFLGLSNHYQVAANWFKQGGDMNNARRCQTRVTLYKCLSPYAILKKMKHAFINRISLKNAIH